jgi:predicted DCC family thiol-disulfide oxidoreductase YuxK
MARPACQAMKCYYVFYDDGCPLCQRIKAWLEEQPQRFPLHLLARADPQVGQRFPGITPWFAHDDLVVASSEGDVWVGPPAWLTVLYTLEDHWEWAFRLTSPPLQQTAFSMIDSLSRNRAVVAGWMGSHQSSDPSCRDRCKIGK